MKRVTEKIVIIKQYVFKLNKNLICYIRDSKDPNGIRLNKIKITKIPVDLLKEAAGRLGINNRDYLDYHTEPKEKEQVMFPPEPPLNITMWRVWYKKDSEPITYQDFVNQTPYEKFSLERYRHKRLYKIQEYSIKATYREIISSKKKPRNEYIINPELVTKK